MRESFVRQEQRARKARKGRETVNVSGEKTSVGCVVFCSL